MAILLSRKLLPDYQAFSATHRWGDPAILEEAIQCCEAAQAGAVNKEAIASVLERLYSVTPDTEDFGDYDGSYALNAAAALLHGLQFLLGLCCIFRNEACCSPSDRQGNYSLI